MKKKNANFRKFLKIMPVVALAVSVTACGGGGGGSTDSGDGNTTPPPPDGSVDQQRVSVMRYDFDNNGTAEGVATFLYDTNGYLSNISYTYTDDGVPDTDFRTFFLDFGNENETHDFVYDTAGRLITRIETTASGRIESHWAWNVDNLVTNYRIEFYSPAGALQNLVRFTLNYTGDQLDSWDEEFELTGSAPTALGEGQISYNMMSGLPELLSRTDLLGGTVEESVLVFTGDGQIQSITTTIPAVPSYENIVSFSYASATHPFVVSGRNREGDIFNRAVTPDDPADTYNWAYSYMDSLLQTQYIDMGSDTIHEAVVSYEWEVGACQRHFIWVPRAEPNFIADGNAPYVPGTGYTRIDYCDTRGSKL